MPPNVTVSIKDLIGTGTNDLLPMPQAATNAQKVIVSGWIKFDENYTFAQGSEIVFADGLPNDVNSGFIVTNGATLMLDSDKGLGKETYLFGCASLWRAIYVEANSTLDIRPGCGIFDAQNAIILRHHSTLLSNGATFQKNIISIRAIPGPNDPPKINVTTILKDNLFFGGSPLSEVFGPLHYPLEGIDAENVSQLSVVSDDPNKPNVFSYYREGTAMLRPIGINTVNTSLVVENARFEHIGLIPTPVNPDLDLAGYGIFAEADDNTTAQIYVKGFGIKGGAQPDPVAFEDVYTGIRARGMNVVIHNAQFKDASTPIELAATVLPRSYQIYNNRFSSYLIAGVSADRLFPTQGFNLYDNEFKDDLNSLGGTRVSANFIAPGGLKSNLLARDNHFIISSPNASTQTIGLYTAGLIGSKVRFNDFAKSVHHDFFAGIEVSGGRSNLVVGNVLSGASLSSDERGIFVSSSPDNDILCNSLDNLDQGAVFLGNACDGTWLSHNEFYTHSHGLFLYDNTTIGQQPNNRNTWSAGVSSGQEEATFDLDPFDIDYVKKLSTSKFLIGVPETPTSEYWANPRFPGGNDWFSMALFPPYQPGPLECIETIDPGGDTPSGLTATDQMVLDDTHPEYGGFPATKWDAQARLYGKLYRQPDLRPTASDAAAFYDAQQSTSFARLAIALEQFAQYTVPDSVLNQYLGTWYVQMTDLMEAIAHTDSLWSAGATGLQQTRNNQVRMLDSIGQLAQTALNNFTAARDVQLSVLQTNVAGVSSATTYEANLKGALGILLTGTQANPAWHWSAAQRNTLTGIAEQCVLAGGYGVVLARLMLCVNSVHPDDCAVQPRQRVWKASEQAYALQVYPNPTSGIVRVANALSGLITLHDQTGRIVLEQASDGAAFNLDLSALPNGIYFLQAIEGQKTSIVHKIFLNK